MKTFNTEIKDRRLALGFLFYPALFSKLERKARNTTLIVDTRDCTAGHDAARTYGGHQRAF